MHSNQQEEIKNAYAGDIVAIAGLKDTTTGDTLCVASKPVILERMEFPEPVISLAVEPKTKADQEKMGVALQRLAAEDPSFRVSSDEESGQTIIAGMGELHLDILVDRMRREFNVEANVGAPQVAYRETITKTVDIDYTHKKQTGGTGQFARIKMRVEPVEAGEGYSFREQHRGRQHPPRVHPRRREGHQLGARGGAAGRLPAARLQGGPLRRGLPRRRLERPGVRDRRARRAAGVQARLGLALLEPVMKVEVVTPEDYTGTVIGDPQLPPGPDPGQEIRGNATVVNAMVPLANMFGYVNNLRSATQGRAQYTMQFDHYEKVPNAVAEEVKAKLAG